MTLPDNHLGLQFTPEPIRTMCGDALLKVHELARQQCETSPKHVVAIYTYTYELVPQNQVFRCSVAQLQSVSAQWCAVVCYAVAQGCGVLDCVVVCCCGMRGCGVVWCGAVRCGVVLCCGVVWCGVVWCGAVQCGVVLWCGVVWCAEGAGTKWQWPGCLACG